MRIKLSPVDRLAPPLKSKRALCVLVIVASTGALAGCGNDKPRSKSADYIAQADKLCAAAKVAGDALGHPKTDVDFAGLVSQYFEFEHRAIDKIRRLAEPESHAAEFAKLWDDMDAAIQRVGKVKSQEEFDTTIIRYKPLNDRARKLGLKECR